jgi:hypothetical protein
MDATPKRRRFRFSVRTMFVALTVVVMGLGWLVWNVEVVRQRKAFLAALQRPRVAWYGLGPNDGQPARLSDQKITYYSEVVFCRYTTPNDSWDPFMTWAPASSRELSWLRRWLGDKPYWFIAYYPGPSGSHAHELFPEANIVVANKPWSWRGVRVIETPDGGWYEENVPSGTQ